MSGKFAAAVVATTVGFVAFVWRAVGCVIDETSAPKQPVRQPVEPGGLLDWIDTAYNIIDAERRRARAKRRRDQL